MKMISNKSRYILICVFAVLLITELIIMDYDNFTDWKNWLALLAPILMIIAMVLSIKQVNKQGEN
ncbi:hypothetical protein [Hyunsoonleella aestuarii]|uniref:hypothetical protein n=1 Tax=Hyunsoonleella aestuarii TaxID=912802 RepID=UPI0014776F8F|nr:hypothetical protein [Hyunsoonleella aestuarii]